MPSEAALERTLDEQLSRAEARYIAANPKSRAQHERAQRVLPAGHSRQTLYFAPFPLTIVSGRGNRVTDLDGHEYLNTISEYVAGVYGHTCKPIQAAVSAALARGTVLTGPTLAEVELAELMRSRIPSLEAVKFCNSGSEACLFAVMTALHATGRRRLLVFEGCYHGGFLVYGATDAPLNAPLEVVRGHYNDVESVRTLLRTQGEKLAAVLVEPMMNAAGCIPGSSEFLRMLREETRACGALLIFDEVGTGRLGPGGVQGLEGITPDMTTLGKFWGGGFSFGAFGGRREIMRHFDLRSGGRLSHGGTFNNNIIATTAGLVGARDVYTPAECEALNARGDDLRARINALGRRRGVALQATGRGGILSLHWHTRPIRAAGDVEPAASGFRRLFQLAMIERGFYASQRGMVSLSLPYTPADLDALLAGIDHYLEEYAHVLPAFDSKLGRNS